MPLYDYEYLDTGERFEHMQPMADAPLTEYQGRPVRKIVAGFPAVQREWQGRESRSIAHGVNPSQIGAHRAIAPSWEFDERTGDAIFKNDAHQRRCFRELAAADARAQEREQERQARDSASIDTPPSHRTDIEPLVDRPVLTP